MGTSTIFFMSMIIMFVFSAVHCNSATAIMFSFTTAILVRVHRCISMTLHARPHRQFTSLLLYSAVTILWISLLA